MVLYVFMLSLIMWTWTLAQSRHACRGEGTTRHSATYSICSRSSHCHAHYLSYLVALCHLRASQWSLSVFEDGWNVVYVFCVLRGLSANEMFATEAISPLWVPPIPRNYSQPALLPFAVNGKDVEDYSRAFLEPVVQFAAQQLTGIVEESPVTCKTPML